MDDIIYMKEAIKEARRALECGEIPVGAVVVRGGEIIGRGHNVRSRDNSPFGHAEIAAMTEAAKRINSWRFDGCSIYVTLEPCVMCSGALVQCRMGRIVFGAKDPKAGGCRSLYEIPGDPRMYHRCAVTGGLLATECAEMLQNFSLKKKGTGGQKVAASAPLPALKIFHGELLTGQRSVDEIPLHVGAPKGGQYLRLFFIFDALSDTADAKFAADIHGTLHERPADLVVRDLRHDGFVYLYHIEAEGRHHVEVGIFAAEIVKGEPVSGGAKSRAGRGEVGA